MANVRFIMVSSTIKVDRRRGALFRTLKTSCCGELLLTLLFLFRFGVNSKERLLDGRRIVGGVGISLLRCRDDGAAGGGAWSDNCSSLREEDLRFFIMARLVTSTKLLKPSHLRLRTESDRFSLISKTSKVHSTISLMLYPCLKSLEGKENRNF